jgi:heme exporter protein A
VKLKVENLGCERNDRYLFSGLKFELAPGELIRVDGANGSGKTTLLRMVSGLLPVDEGIVYWGNRPIQKNRADYMSELLFVGHKNGIKDELTAEENLRIDHSLAGGQSGVSYAMALDRLGIAQCRHQLCRQLSAGQRQRVALARLLISVVRLWVLDEPLTALDRSAQDIVRDLLAEHVGAGGMALITSHQDLDWQGRTQRTIRLGDG